MRTFSLALCAAVFCSVAICSARMNEVWSKEETEAAGLVHKGSHVISPLPQDYIDTKDLPTNFTWCDQDGVNYCTKSLNQHIPQVPNPTLPPPCPSSVAQPALRAGLLAPPRRRPRQRP